MLDGVLRGIEEGWFQTALADSRLRVREGGHRPANG